MRLNNPTRSMVRLIVALALGVAATLVAGAPAGAQTGDFRLTNVGAYLASGQNRCIGIAADKWAGLWTCTKNPNDPRANCNGGFYLVNYNSGLVVGVAAGSTANGADLVQYDLKDHNDQYWSMMT